MAPYPALAVRRELDADAWTQLESVWIDAIELLEGQEDTEPQLQEFVESYLRGKQEEFADGKGMDNSSELRSVVFDLVVNRSVLGPRPSPEILWAFVVVYGPLNVQKTVEFLLELERRVPVIAKIGRVALSQLQAGSSDALIRATAVLLSSRQVSKLVRTLEWEEKVRRLHDPAAESLLAVDFAVSELQITAADTDPLRDLFPQLSLERAAEILREHKGSVEEATSYLLENPHALETPASAPPQSAIPVAPEKYRPVTKESRLEPATEDSVAATLRLVYEADEDERDDTYDDALQGGEEPRSSSGLMKTEQYLWDLYSRTPDVFKRDSRKHKMRAEMKRTTEWTDEQIEGWARVLERNPRRRQFLEDRYMFQGNLPHLRNSIWRDQKEEEDTEAGSSSAGPSQAPSQAPSRSASRERRTPAAEPSKHTKSLQKHPRDKSDDNKPSDGQNSSPASGEPKQKPRNSYRKRNAERQFRKNKATKKQGLDG